MAFESQTYETIMQRILERVPQNLDKRVSSPDWHASAPAAVEMAILYTALDFILEATFADTAPREYLTRRAAERGVVPFPATVAVLRGDFNKEVPIGSRFSLENLKYTATERMAEDDTPTTKAYRVRCETEGTVGNTQLGDLIPIDYIEGLTSARLTVLLIPGEDEEDTEVFRRRYYTSLDAQAFGGNVADYVEKTNKQPGVGGCKIYPTPAGGGTVGVVLIDSQFKAPSDTLLAAVQAALDPIGHSGQGLGLAPIGHCVTVAGVENTMVDIAFTIVYQEGWHWEDVKPYALAGITAHFSELAQSWADSGSPLVVRISQLETRLLGCPGVVDVGETTINGATTNFVLEKDSIPVGGVLIG